MSWHVIVSDSEGVITGFSKKPTKETAIELALDEVMALGFGNSRMMAYEVIEKQGLVHVNEHIVQIAECKEDKPDNLFEMLVYRPNGVHIENAILIRCKKNEKVKDVSSFIKALEKALVEWFKNTKNGKEAYDYSCEYFNFGDLLLHFEDSDLVRYLKEEGIEDLTISDEVKYNHGYGYDRILATLPDEE